MRRQVDARKSGVDGLKCARIVVSVALQTKKSSLFKGDCSFLLVFSLLKQDASTFDVGAVLVAIGAEHHKSLRITGEQIIFHVLDQERSEIMRNDIHAVFCALAQTCGGHCRGGNAPAITVHIFGVRPREQPVQRFAKTGQKGGIAHQVHQPQHTGTVDGHLAQAELKRAILPDKTAVD